MTNKGNLGRLKKKFDAAVVAKEDEQLYASLPSSFGPVTTRAASKSVTTRADSGSIQTKIEDVCVFCNETYQPLHSVSTVIVNMCSRLRHIHNHTSKNVLKVRLNIFKISSDPLIGIAHEIKYHRSCLTKEERGTETSVSKNEDHQDNYILSEMEFIASLTCALNDSDEVVDMKMATETFINILKSNNATGPCQTKNVKAIITKNMPQVIFIKPKRKNQSEVLELPECSKYTPKTKYEEYKL